MPHAFRSIATLGLAAVAVSACATRQSAESDSGDTQGRLVRAIFQPDIKKRSQFDGKAFQSKAVRTKEFRTGEAHVDREFHGGDRAFNVTARQGRDYSAESSRFQEMVSPMAAKTREYSAAARAQENPIRGSDLVIGESAGSAPGGTTEDGRLLSVPADLRPDTSSVIGTAAGKPLSIDDVRRILNKGSR
jgi:hypothetical protein